MRNQDQIKKIIDKYHQGKCTADELKLLQEFLSDGDQQSLLEEVYDELDAPVDRDVVDARKDQLLQGILRDPRIQERKNNPAPLHKIHRFRKWPSIAVAIIALLLAAPVVYLYMVQPDGSVPVADSQPLLSAIVPGGDKAHIMLEDGTVINLDQIQGDTVIQRSGFSIVKRQDGAVYYQYDRSGESAQQTVYNTIVTPKGGQYKIELPDGTRVSLNAASSLRYPVYFEGDERRVELVGEGYFDVAKSYRNDKSIPFVVHTRDQKLEVLGTEFNIDSYGKRVKTTLIEGKVRLATGTDPQEQVILEPNQQALLQDQQQSFAVQQVDPLYAMAWTKGNFAFQKATIQEVLESIARWYDVEVVFKGTFKDVYFTGTLSRFENIDKLLRVIEVTESVRFKIEGRRVLVLE